MISEEECGFFTFKLK